jgi:hypothetical protein
MKKESGALLEVCICLFCIVAAILILLWGVSMRRIRTAYALAEDSLTASLLGGAVADIKRYGTDHTLVVTSGTGAEADLNGLKESYGRFTDTLRTNLQLNSQFLPLTDTYVQSVITVHAYIIYNVDPNYREEGGEKVLVTVSAYREEEEQAGSGSGTFLTEGRYVYDRIGDIDLKTPNGVPIEATTLYGDIGFMINSFAGRQEYVHVRQTVDMIQEEEAR